jgi:hypothetical protein
MSRRDWHRNDCMFNRASSCLTMALVMAGEEARAWSMVDAKGMSLLTGHERVVVGYICTKVMGRFELVSGTLLCTDQLHPKA